MTDALPALQIEGLEKTFANPEGGRVRVISLPALEVGAGEHLAVHGESGAGKTTLLHLVAGILKADAGTIRVAGDLMTGCSEVARDRLRAKHIGYLFQTFNLLPTLTALENVALGMSFRPGGARKSRERARQALVRVGLDDRWRYRPGALSVGQQQRVAIARALVGNPALLLADEPTSNLDAARADACLDLLLEFSAESGAALVMVSHDERALSRVARRFELEVPEGSVA